VGAIFGILSLDGATVDPGELRRMGRAMAHRGPDGCEVLAMDHIGLGVCLMRVQVEDGWEAQPLHDSALGVTLVADARLDNREELAALLALDEQSLSTMADSMLLQAAWRRWGEQCVDHLIGDFTFAVWDHRAKRLHLVRDHMGQRGLFIHQAESIVVFASEVKALWAVDGVPRRLDPVGVARRLLLTLDPDPARTLYAQVRVLPGGCIESIDLNGRAAQRRYWRPHAGAQHLGRDEAYYLEAYRSIVEEAIACRVRRLERGGGLLMSGGFDSGMIAAIAAPILHGAGRKLTGIASVLPLGDRSAAKDARKAVAAFEGRPGLDLLYQEDDGADFFAQSETNFLREDSPMAVGPMRRRGYAALGGLRVRQVMDGHGGDYTVNGVAQGMLGRLLLQGKVSTFLREVRARRDFTRWSWMRIAFYDVLRPLMPEGWMRWLALVMRGGRPLWRDAMTCDTFAQEAMLEGGIAKDRLRDARVAAGKWEGRWQHMLWRIVNTACAQTPAAVHGLVLTRPFHDPRVVELGLALPSTLHFRNGRDRWLARTGMADCLPQSLLTRRPGNDREEPLLHEAIMAGADAELARLEQNGGEAARYVDPVRITAALASSHRSGMLVRNEAYRAAAALMMARFADWLEPRNSGDQEP
jgi:asparagine synthase (glutamine-hydrolysing)